jgi:hypothetical protein
MYKEVFKLIITEINEGKKTGYKLEGNVLTIGGQVSINLEERQSDTQKVIDVCLDNQLQTMREGLGAWYVATIIIPPKQRELVPTGEKDPEGNDIYEERDRELDTRLVELRLWSLPVGYGEKTNETDETEGAEE